MADEHYTNSNEAPSPYFSVLIGRVSTEDSRRILETLNALRNQKNNPEYEVVIADRLQDETTREIAMNYPEVRLLEAGQNESLPVLRTRALHVARGNFIIVTEDHCVPPHNWLQSFLKVIEAEKENTAAFGGCVENGVANTALDRATFLCEYSFFQAPVVQGNSEILPGMNVAYRAEVLHRFDPQILESGFWETTVHPKLVSNGYKLYSSNSILLYHKKKFSLSLFLKQRFIYSQYYAGLRFRKEEKLHRGIAFLASLLLPPILLFRMIRDLRKKDQLNKNSLSALPYLFLFTLLWAIGEMWGYLAGTRSSLIKIE